MCLLILAFHALPNRPVVVAANRDEVYDRPSASPRLLCASPRILGGVDLVAGGTWVGVNEHGVIAAVTNRSEDGAEMPGRPSRGLLCLEALKCRTALAAVRHAATEVAATRYNPFNLVAVSLDEAWTTSNCGVAGPVQLTPGWHVVANGAVDDRQDPRVCRTEELLANETYRLGELFPVSLARLCRDHGAVGVRHAPDALCLHRAKAGTRSSTLIVIQGRQTLGYWHTEGPPCETSYQQVPIPWALPGAGPQ